MRAKTYSRKEFELLLKKNGYVLMRHHGSHSIYKKDNSTITFPYSCNKMICRRLIKENNLI